MILSFRTEQSEVKNVGSIAQLNTWVLPRFFATLRFALNDKTDATYFLRITKN